MPSRRRALDALTAHVLAEGPGPALLTGEPGVGKSWLCRKMREELPPAWRTLSVAASGALDPAGLLELIADGLDPDDEGTPRGLAANRLRIARSLREEAAEGRRWLLVLEEAQDASAGVWSELAALVHAMESDQVAAGFAGMLLVGTTGLTRLLMGRRRDPLAGRLGLHIHLPPLDVEECRVLVESEAPRPLDPSSLEDLHRRNGGNPRRILRAIRARSDRSAPEPAPGPSPSTPGGSRPVRLPEAGRILAPTPASVARASRTPERPYHAAPGVAGLVETPTTAALIPSRPPLRVEEGLIEVGWGGSLEADAAGQDDADLEDAGVEGRVESLAGPRPIPAGDDTPAPPPRFSMDASILGDPLPSPPQAAAVSLPQADEAAELPSEEMVEDHYAALQAWAEWARNRGRAVDAEAEGPDPTAEARPSARPRAYAAAAPEAAGPEAPPSVVRVEAEHEHAPYGQLFSRLRQGRP
ncbi:ExeA family protein [Aquisphaera giovannonii]|uniref:ExeA family protein n=1 Tax=Aquisphaera giovannonii TaxID=406548 RepID=UPI00143CE849|nr:ATP-binding protein [Aquisphaera giovannonii]